jgi:hypothetical protein
MPAVPLADAKLPAGAPAAPAAATVSLCTIIDLEMAEATRTAAIVALIGKRDRHNPPLKDMASLLLEVLSDPSFEEHFPEFVKLATIALAIPVATADAERGYSRMNIIKTMLRNRLGEQRLLDAMRAAIYNVPASQVDWKAVITLWLKARNRQLKLSPSSLAPSTKA